MRRAAALVRARPLQATCAAPPLRRLPQCPSVASSAPQAPVGWNSAPQAPVGWRCPPPTRPARRWASSSAAAPDDDDDDHDFLEPDRGYFEIVEDIVYGTWEQVSPVGWFQSVIELFHSGGFSWWMSVFLVSALARVAISPINLYTTRNAQRMGMYTEDLQGLKLKKQSLDQAKDIPEKDANAMRASIDLKIAALQKKGGFSESVSFLGILQIIPLISMYYAVRYLAKVEPTMAESLLWIPNLLQPDPYCILPVVSFATLGLQMEANSEGSGRSLTAVGQKWAFRAMSVVGLYWFSTEKAVVVFALLGQGVGGMAPVLLGRHKGFREWYGLKEPTAKLRSNLAVVATKPTTWKDKLSAKLQELRGADREKKATRLGGGLGNVAHAPRGPIQSAASFKVSRKK
eukprot:TRINITY_DN12354_c0_g1_i1.p1 TRINITY_DN12354_c0_g1~~TRINITY_DN12354_c0_g1_i1.p1  ORF type:complete len:402 (+),score=82.05 TRINITY_DN12354_c0_g1_i1:70-1275(+)